MRSLMRDLNEGKFDDIFEEEESLQVDDNFTCNFLIQTSTSWTKIQTKQMIKLFRWTGMPIQNSSRMPNPVYRPLLMTLRFSRRALV